MTGLMIRSITISFFLTCSTINIGLLAQPVSLPQSHSWYKQSASGWQLVGRDSLLYDDQSRVIKETGLNIENNSKRLKLITYLSDTSRIEVFTENEQGTASIYYDSIVSANDGMEISYALAVDEASIKTWVPSTKKTIVKDRANHVLKETYERYRGGNWHLEDRMLYYFEGDLCRVEIFQMREDADWVTHQKSMHHYKNGKLRLTELLYPTKSALVPEIMMPLPEERIAYHYDKHGRLAERIAQRMINGKWVNEFKRSCTY
jgi:hypothetical protein